MSQKIDELPRDPDPWTVVNLVVCSVAMFAQLASLAMQAMSMPSSMPSARNSVASDKLKDSVENALRNVERLIKLLQKGGNGGHGSAIAEPFRFAASRACFEMTDFNRYKELVAKIALDAGTISTWTLTVIQTDPAFASGVGAIIVSTAGNVQERINRLFLTNPTNETVLDECLSMLKSFQKILDSLDQTKN